jgi:hypothetical protein
MEAAIAVSKNERRVKSETRPEMEKNPIQVEILGSGNAVSRMTAQVLDAATRDLGLVLNQDVQLYFVRDAAQIASSGVYWTPAVRINGTLKCTGRVPSLQEVRDWLEQSVQRPSL